MPLSTPPTTSLLVAGLGCRKGCSAEELERLLLQALALHGLSVSALDWLASSAHKTNEPGLLQLAERLQLPIRWLPASQLADQDAALSAHSALSRQVSGSAGVAEASALAQAAAASGQPARLLCSKLRSDNATCALACAPFSQPMESA